MSGFFSFNQINIKNYCSVFRCRRECILKFFPSSIQFSGQCIELTNPRIGPIYSICCLHFGMPCYKKGNKMRHNGSGTYINTYDHSIPNDKMHTEYWLSPPSTVSTLRRKKSWVLLFLFTQGNTLRASWQRPYNIILLDMVFLFLFFIFFSKSK